MKCKKCDKEMEIPWVTYIRDGENKTFCYDCWANGLSDEDLK